MSKSLFDNLQSALSNHAVVMSAANAQQKAETDSAYGKQISTLKEDITALSRDFSERYPDLLNAQDTLNDIDHSFNSKAVKGFNKTAAKGITVEFKDKTDLEKGSSAAVFRMGNPEHGHTLTVTSKGNTFYDEQPLKEAMDHESAPNIKVAQLENIRKLTGVSHNYLEYGEHVVKTCANQLPAKDDAVKKAMESGVGLEEAIQAANTFDFE